MSSDEKTASDDEAYRKFIVMCDGSLSDESQKENVPMKKIKTKKEQFALMTNFASGNLRVN